MQKTYSRGEDKKEIERKRQEGRMRQKKKEFLKSYKKNNYRLDIGSVRMSGRVFVVRII